jgi:hypothetical protein
VVTALRRKLVRDLWHLRGQALAIAVVIGGGVATLIMSLSSLDSLMLTRDTFYRDYRFAHVFAQLKRAPESLRVLIETVPGVQQVETRSAPSTIVPFIQQRLIVSRADDGAAHDVHDVGTIAVRGHWHLRSRAQLRQQRLSLSPRQLLTALVHPPRTFLNHVVGPENGAQRRDDRWRRSGDQQGRERAVIEPQLRRHGEGLTTSQALGRRQQDLFLHADVLE